VVVRAGGCLVIVANWQHMRTSYTSQVSWVQLLLAFQFLYFQLKTSSFKCEATVLGIWVDACCQTSLRYKMTPRMATSDCLCYIHVVWLSMSRCLDPICTHNMVHPRQTFPYTTCKTVACLGHC